MRGLISTCIATVVCVPLVFAQSPAKLPLDLEDVATLVQLKEVASPAKASFIEKRCVSFKMTFTDSERLRALGADAALLRTIDKSCYTPPSSAPEAAPVEASQVKPIAATTRATPLQMQAPKRQSAVDSMVDAELAKRVTPSMAGLSPADAARAAKFASGVEKVSGFLDAMKADDEARRLEIAEANESMRAHMTERAPVARAAMEARRIRLAEGKADVLGFAVALRPGVDVVAIPSIQATLLDSRVFTVRAPNNSGGLLLYGIAASRSPSLTPRPAPAKDANIADSEGVAVRFVMLLRVPPADGKTTVKLACIHYAPNGNVIKRFEQKLRPNKGETALEWSSVIVSEKGWAPGIYGVECAADGLPFVNATYDVF